MAENPVNNRKIVLKPTAKPKLDIGESTIFSKQVDVNLWDTVSKKIVPKEPEKNSIEYQIFKVGQEAQKYEELLSKPFGNKLNLNC